MSPSSLSTFSTAKQMLGALRQRKISAVELLELHLAQIEKHNPRLNAIVIPNYEAARQEAQATDESRQAGQEASLLGLPFTVKDWIEVEGLPSTAGDPQLKGYIAKKDNAIVSRLRQAGAILFGKTNMAPWGGDWTADNPVFGRTNNPWNLDFTPGGSTGGGAAAVAAGLTPLEFGNDIGGSVRVPPAFCGVYGHRPSETAWPRAGQTPDFSGQHLPNPVTAFGVVGPLARSAEDLEMALHTACGPEVGEGTAWRLELPPARHLRLADFRVALLPPVPWLPVDEAILAAQERLVEGLGRLGTHVETVQPESFDDLHEFTRLYHRLLVVQMTSGMPKQTRRRIARWAHKAARERDDEIIEAGAQAFEADAADYIQWFGRREQFRAAYRAFFQDWDILLTPVTFSLAFRHSDAPPEVDMDDRTLTVNGQPVRYRLLEVYPGLATLCGQPATVFPFGMAPSGLPVGLQAIGPYLEDYTPLRFAALVAQEFGGYQAPPGY